MARNGKSRSGGKNRPKPSNNYQDKSEMREYRKGERVQKWRDDTRESRRNSKTAENANVPVGTGSSDNDPSWYVPNSQLLKDVASLPFGVSNGRPVAQSLRYTPEAYGDALNALNPDKHPISLSGTATPMDQVTPGVMVFDIVPAIGEAKDGLSPINVAGNALFTAMQAKSGRQPQYEAPNLQMYNLAMSSAYACYVYMVRAYGIMRNYNMLNRYTPEVLIQAMGFDYINLRDNMAEFRAGINQFALKLASFYVPKEINYITRQIFMFENVYMDANSPKAQYYMYNPYGFLLYEEGTEATISSARLQLRPLPFQTVGSSLMTVTTILNYANQLIEPLRLSEDIRLMGADMLNTFGEGGMFSVLPIAETYSLNPVYNAEVLSQMENAYIYPKPIPYNGSAERSGVRVSITENTDINAGYLQAEYHYFLSIQTDATHNRVPWPQYTPYGVFKDNNIVLNSHKDSVTPEDVMVMTRLSSSGFVPFAQTDYTQGALDMLPDNIASEFVAGGRLLFYTLHAPTGVTGQPTLVEYPFCTDMLTYPGSTMLSSLGNDSVGNIIAVVSTFDWHPRVRRGEVSIRNATDTAVGYTATHMTIPYWDLENWSFVTSDMLNRINEIALLGLFTCTLPNSLGS